MDKFIQRKPDGQFALCAADGHEIANDTTFKSVKMLQLYAACEALGLNPETNNGGANRDDKTENF